VSHDIISVMRQCHILVSPLNISLTLVYYLILMF